MAKFHLVNTVQLVGTKLLAGALIDDENEDTAKLLRAGAILVPDDSADAAIVAGARDRVTEARLRGADERACESIMTTALLGMLYPQSGDSSHRPANPYVGQPYFDTSWGFPLWWSGTHWVDATGLAHDGGPG